MSSGLAPILATREAHDRVLRSAAYYPLMLAFTVVFSATVVLETALPALAQIEGVRVSAVAMVGSLCVAFVLLVALAMVAFTGLSVPWLSAAPRRVDTWAFLAGAGVLVADGSELAAALRSSIEGLRAVDQSRGRTLARSLEAGSAPPDVEPLLSTFETQLLFGAARVGAGPEALAAIVETRQLALDVEVPRDAARLQTVAVVLAGVAMLAVAGTYFAAYSSALRVGL